MKELRAPRGVPPDIESPHRAHRTKELDDPGRLLCRACGAPITSRAEQTSVAGSHVHLRTNPAGITFRFGCFSSAPGAIVHGPPTGEHSWFAGLVWSFTMCGGCGEHLGWHFEGAERFHALILDRLVDESRPTRH